MVGKTISHDTIPEVFEPVSPYKLTRTVFKLGLRFFFGGENDNKKLH